MNYGEKDFKIKGNSDMTFKESIKSFLVENKGEFSFRLNGEIIGINKKLKELGIKNGDKVNAEKI